MTKQVYRFSVLIWLLALGAAAQAQPIVIGYTNCVAVTNYSQSLMNQIAQLKWYFAHASVGECIMEGVTNLHLSNPGFYQLHGISSGSSPPATTQAGVIYDDDRGNPVYFGDYQVKLNLFGTAVTNGWCFPKVNIAMTKFCFIDIWTTQSSSAVAAELSSYLNTLTNLEAAYPQTLFPYATMPVPTTNYTYAGEDYGASTVYWRNVFNNSLRAWCGANQRVLFDIADIESHDTNGNPTTFIYNGLVCQQMWSGDNVGGDQCCGEVGDGAHPTNLRAEQLMAKGFYALAAATLGRWSTNNGAAPVAVADAYTARENTTLTVAAPGVLANDTDPGSHPLTAIKISDPAHGVLALNTNGGFIYTPAGNYFGADSFTYQANDGVTNSATATVTLTVATNSPPVAVNDSYAYWVNTTLTVAAPGILSNDSDPNGNPLTAVLASAPTNGSLTLNADGSFAYTPATNFAGTDSFTYLAYDGFAYSSTGMVVLTSVQAGTLFSDNFTRSTDPGPLAPWLAQAGAWTVTGGVLKDGPTALNSYSYAYITNNWTDYAVSARVQFSANGYGGGLGGRLNAATGARYAVWIYPSGNDLNLVKFTDWSTHTFPVASVSLPPLGTNWHTLGLAFQGNRIAAYCDGVQVVSFTDNSAPLTSGGISAEMYTSTSAVTLSVDNVVVSPLLFGSAYSVNENSPLTVSSPGILANYTDVYGTNQTATVGSGPAHGALSLNAHGGFTYTPAANFAGSDSFSFQANNGLTNSLTATVSLTITSTSTNPAPVAVADAYTLRENTALTVAAPGVLANDTDPGGHPLTAIKISDPGHGILALNANGGFTYTPASNYFGADSFTYQANDGITNSATATVTLTVASNVPPVAVNDSYAYGVNTTLTVAAPGILSNDTDANGNPLTAVLASAPANGSLTLNADGSFAYTPATNFAGTDSFTYLTYDGSAYSSTGLVVLTAIPAGVLFSDNFTRATDPGPLAPWQVEAGAWMVTGGVLKDGPTALNTYSYAYITNNWTDYAVSAQLQFSVNGYGGGLGGRLNAATGARYAAWIYPGGNKLNLVKFTDWSTHTFLALNIGLPTLGTNWHALELAFQGNLITAYCDGVQVVSVTDSSTPLTSGGITAEMYTSTSAVTLAVDNVVVSAAVATNTPPVAVNDSYAYGVNTTLTVAAPGILSNDSDANGNSLTAVLASAPANGSLTLKADGSFAYTPATNFAGTDSFTYRAYDGSAYSSTGTVVLTAIPTGVLFSDNFTRATDPGPLAPWLVKAGAWTVTGGVLKDGPTALNSYSYAYVTSNWTDYAVSAQLQFSANGYGGGLGGRLNAATGARYAAWIYPSGNNLNLVKFTDWSTHAFLALNIILPPLGTNWHTLELAFLGNQIAAYCDGVQVVSVTDNSAPLTSGGITAEMWTAASAVTLSVDNVVVNPISGLTMMVAANNTVIVEPPMINSFSVSDGVAIVTWSAVAGHTYRLQFQETLSATNWNDMQPDILADSATASATNSVGSSGSGFIRVMLVQ